MAASTTDVLQKQSVTAGQPQKFVKMKGFANMKGEWFEVKLAALLFLRAKNSGCQFQLATNAKGADALDDIIFKIKPLGDPDWHISFIQLKHKEFAKLNIDQFIDPGGTGNFSLKKYLRSCNEIKKMVSDTSKQVLFRGTFDLCNFVIYTNAEVNYELEKRVINNSLGPMDVFLKCDLERERIFSFDEERDKDVYSFMENFGVAESREFLKRLKIFSGQPSEEQLDDFIKEQLPTALGKNKTDADLMYRFYEEEFKLWWRDSNYILDQDSDILVKTQNRFQVETLSPQQEEKFRLKLRFLDNSTEVIARTLRDKTAVIHLIADRLSLRLSCTKLLQALNARQGSYIFFGTECLTHDRNSLISAWNRSSNHLLVIVSESTGGNEMRHELCQAVCDILGNNNDKQMVVLSAADDEFAKSFREKLGTKFTSILDSFELSDLEEESRDNVLQQELLYQGYPTTLTSLLDGEVENASDMLKELLVETITSKNPLAIGDDVTDVIHYYIRRTIERRNVVNTDFFKDRTLSGQIVISDMNLMELHQLLPVDEQTRINQLQDGSVGDKSKPCQIRTVDLQTAEAQYNNVCENNADVHWLHKENGRLVWRRSQGNIDLIKQYVNEDICNTLTPDTAMDVDERIVLLVAEPGMGKSTILVQLAKETKEAFPNLWVIRIALNDHTALLAGINENNFDAMEFLSSTVGVDKMPAIDQALFKLNVARNGKAVVLLDGFDEIAPRYAKECCTLLTKLLATKVQKIWVTSRHSMKETLEKHLSTLALTLRKFDEQDQRNFFTKFWRNVTTLSDEDLGDFITELLLLARKSLHDKEQEFTGIPLQTHMMAEVFEEHVKDNRRRKLPEKMDLLLLIEEFVEKKLTIYYQEKMKISDAHTDYEDLLKEKREAFLKNHTIAALVLLLDEREIRNLHKKVLNKKSKMFLEDIKNGKDKTGIIDSVVAEKPHFLHRVFAEYFAAKWLAKHFAKNQSFFEHNFSGDNYAVVREIFDRILARDRDLHTAVLNTNIEEVARLLTMEGTNVNDRDLGGRTALHLAASVYWRDQQATRRDTRIAELLLGHKADINLVDRVIHGTPLRYADRARCWYIVDILLRYENINLDHLVSTKANIADQTMWEDVIEHSYVQLLACLLDNGLHLNSTFSEEQYSESLLHKAAHFGSDPVATLLIRRVSGVTQEDSEKSTPLHSASRAGHQSTVQILLDTFSEANDVITYINTANRNGDTAVHCSVVNKRPAVLKMLIEAGGSVTATNGYLSTPLHMASLGTDLTTVQLLIDRAADATPRLSYVNSRDMDGSSALYWAAEQGHVGVVNHLIKLGSDVTLAKNSGDTALHVAVTNGHSSVARVLLDSVTDKTRRSEFVNMRNKDGYTALYRAAQQDHSDIAVLLTAEGADVGLASDDGFNALQKAAEKGHADVVRALIASMPDDHGRLECINAPASDCDTALFWATIMGHADVVAVLLEAGADHTRRDADDASLLHTAVTQGHRAVIETLLNHVAGRPEAAQFVNAVDSDNRTAASLAAQFGYEDIVEVLADAVRTTANSDKL